MVDLYVVVDVLCLGLLLVVFCQYELHEVVVMLFLLLGEELYRTVEVYAVESGVCFVSVGEFQEVGELTLTLSLL